MSRRSTGSPAPLSLVKKRRLHHHNNNLLHKVTLDKIVGLTCVTSNGLSVSSETGCIAYPAGCVAVLHLPQNHTQQLHILNTTKKPISSLCLSPDGKYLAIGEYGHQPSVQVWNLANSPNHVSELKAHKYGIQCMAFSPSMRYMVSVGYQHDMHIHVWNWKTGNRVASNKITSKVCGVSFSEDSKYFVTVGNRRVRFWTMLPTGREENRTAPLKGRSAVLGDLQDNCFVAVQCGRGTIAAFTYALTRTGILCKFDQDRSLEQFVNVQAKPGRSLSLCESYVICGCGEGVVRLFDPCALDYLVTLPLPHHLGVDVGLPLNPGQPLDEEGKKFADVIATGLDETNKKLSVVYSDHSHYVWNILNLRQIKKCHSSLHHSACVWDLCFYPTLPNEATSHLPHSTFVTCSTDSTARFWTSSTTSLLARQGSVLQRNVYSKDLMRVIYTSSDFSSLSDSSKYPGDASAVGDMQRGVRCVQFHPQGHQLALGDRAGNIRVYELQFLDIVFEVEAHISEVLCIEYSPLHNGHQFMCSASRDRLIHVFSTTDDEYCHIQTIDDHSASITALKFTVRGGDLQLLSCGADKSIMFRTLQKSPSLEFTRTSHIACKASIYDMDIDVVGKNMVTAGQDRLLRIYQISSGKQKAVIKASTGDEGSLIKVAMDPSGLYVACSSSDKTVSIFDFYSAECLAKLYGHSEMVTQIKFSTDCKYLYSVSGDGCIFTWRLSQDVTQTMYDRLTEIGAAPATTHQLTPEKVPSSPLRRQTYSIDNKETDSVSERDKEEVDNSGDAQFRLSLSQLPSWAKKQVQSRPSIALSYSTSSLEKAGIEGGREREVVPPAHGCWAERAGRDTTKIGVGLLNRTTSAPDITVIDLTSPEKEERKDEDETDVFFHPPLPPTIDSSAFKVTTPEKKTNKRQQTGSLQEDDEEEGEEEEEEGGSDNSTSSPGGPRDYLQTTFETLSSEKAADEFFSKVSPPDLNDVRLSISARFFSSQSGNSKWLGLSQSAKKSWSSPNLQPVPLLIPSTVNPSPLVEVESQREKDEEEGEGKVDGGGGEGKREGEGEGIERVAEKKEEDKGKESAKEEKESESGEHEVSKDVNDRETISEESTKLEKTTKRSPAIQEEIEKTRKRLEQLGYGAMVKESESNTDVPPPPHLDSDSPPPPPPCSEQQSVVEEREETVMEEREETVMDEQGQSLLEQVNQCITGINDSFRNMISLHQMAVERLTVGGGGGGGGGERERDRQECQEAISTISTAVISLKRRAGSMATRHRRRWREVQLGRRRRRGTDSSTSSSRESFEKEEEEKEESEEIEEEVEEAEEVEGRGEGTQDGADGENKERGVEMGVAGELGGVVKSEEVLGLLDRYSQQLIDLVRQRTLSLSNN